jgi:Bacterial Ig-like domain
VRDLAGNALATDASWTFTTGGDATPPTITARSPGAAATGVALSASVTATFSEAMTAASISASTFTLRDPAGNTVGGAVSYSATSLVATLNPSGTLALSGGTVYTATVRGGAGGTTDSAGNPLAADVIWTFTTTPPVVSATVPASGAVSVSRTANITATFNGPMNASTINGTTVTLQTSSGTAIPAVVSVQTLSTGATRAVLNPNGTLGASTSYRVTVRGGSTGVITPTGVGMATDRTWTFTTGVS